MTESQISEFWEMRPRLILRALHALGRGYHYDVAEDIVSTVAVKLLQLNPAIEHLTNYIHRAIRNEAWMYKRIAMNRHDHNCELSAFVCPVTQFEEQPEVREFLSQQELAQFNERLIAKAWPPGRNDTPDSNTRKCQRRRALNILKTQAKTMAAYA